MRSAKIGTVSGSSHTIFTVSGITDSTGETDSVKGVVTAGGSSRGDTTAVGASSSSSCNASKRAFICWIFRFATIFNVGLASLEMACIKHFNS